jgi:hypothetical protein
MRAQTYDVCTSSQESNYQLALDPRQVSSMGAAFEEAWLRFAQAAPAGMDWLAEASLRQLIAVRIIRAAQSGQLDHEALVALALHGL